MDSKDLSGVKHVRLDMTARDKGKGGPDKGHTTSFSPSKVVHCFPNFRSYFGMEYEQPWNMGKILLDIYIYLFIYLFMLYFIQPLTTCLCSKGSKSSMEKHRW